jgi:hypothetical protein
MKDFIYLLAFIIFPLISFSQSNKENDKEELARISRALDNPLAKMWSLVFQENLAINQGKAVDGSVTTNTFFFQPALPIPVGNNLVFTARPVFPIVTQPDFAADPTGNTSSTGFGDIQMVTLLGPGKASGWVWGGGATVVCPTASKDNLGKGKYQAGPAIMIFHLSKYWTKGLFFQHWWSYAGDDLRNDVSRTDIQYIFRRNFGTVSLGMGPTISVDWSKDKDRVTFPIGLGVTKTVRIGKTPFKLRFEPQYSIIKPDDYGTLWNFRLQIAPVIKSPFLD